MVGKQNTLEESERAWAPYVRALLCVSLVASLLLLGVSAYATWGPKEPDMAVRLPWVVCFLVWLAISGSNLRYLASHRKLTVGMMPVEVFSLVPVSLSVLIAGPSFVWRCLGGALFVVSAAVTALFLLWFLKLRGAYAGWLMPESSAIVIVLGAAAKKGRPSTTLALRLDQAASCARANPACTLVLTGGPLSDQSGTEADVMARYLLEQGIDRSQILVERRARNTKENIAFSLELARTHGATGELCVLTSDYHLYRARKIGHSCDVDLSPIPAITPKRSRLQQWCREVLTILYQK